MANRDHQRRVELARAEGYRSYHERNMAKQAAERGDPSKLRGVDRALHDATGRAKFQPGESATPRRTGPAPERRQIIDTPAGTILRTTAQGRGWAVIEQRLQRLEFGTVTQLVAKVRDAGGVRSVELFSNGGITVSALNDLIDRVGSLRRAVEFQLASQYGGAGDVVGVELVVSA